MVYTNIRILILFVMIKNEFDISELRANIKKKVDSFTGTMERMALQHFDNSFKNQGFTDTTMQPWRKTKSGKTNSFGSQSQGILIGTGRLRRGTKKMIRTPNRLVIVNNTPYASAHNDGVNKSATVKSHTRTFKYNYGKNRINKTINVQSHIRNMKLPKRRFMGNSRYLNNMFKQELIKQIRSCFKY